MSCKVDAASSDWGDTFGNVGSSCQLYKLNDSKTGYLKDPKSFLRNNHPYSDCCLSLTRVNPNGSDEVKASAEAVHETKIIQVFVRNRSNFHLSLNVFFLGQYEKSLKACEHRIYDSCSSPQQALNIIRTLQKEIDLLRYPYQRPVRPEFSLYQRVRKMLFKAYLCF